MPLIFTVRHATHRRRPRLPDQDKTSKDDYAQTQTIERSSLRQTKTLHTPNFPLSSPPSHPSFSQPNPNVVSNQGARLPDYRGVRRCLKAVLAPPVDPHGVGVFAHGMGVA
ncbi:hypothetical protein CH63R_06318 [Colletotrichum higginsianum IMI 349063]|uniref:Uncharacterized protein n=1 Tax=Colletotrichum higginsianum (strain IMI 349063) TaxID=759273 RepID=A0A1B7YF24_COLHI|nr:hypothetical protein CH63R_06318 [Colletotrichum higginsianum IMI 349063]OBR10626.1 hypothetical protein CH63R_06318 [Colletotrichum higginsianum IMI 349063]